MLSKSIFGALLSHGQRQLKACRHLSQGFTVEIEKPEWTKAVKEAEQILDFPASFMVLRHLFNDDIANIALNLRNFSSANHPLLKAIEDFIFGNEIPAWGLIVLLYSRTVGLQGDHPDETKDMKYFIYAKSLYEISRMRNQELLEIASSSLQDLAESEFIGDRNILNIHLPAKPTRTNKDVEIEGGSGTEFTYSEKALGNAKAEWNLRNILSVASVLGKSCHGTMYLAKHSKDMQRQGYLFGKHVALSWQAFVDQKPFLNDHIGPFSLVSGPVLFHLQHETDFYREIIKDCDNINDSKYNDIKHRVLQGAGVKTKMLQKEHSEAALSILKQFPDNEAHIALKNIIISVE